MKPKLKVLIILVVFCILSIFFRKENDYIAVIVLYSSYLIIEQLEQNQTK